MKISEIKEKVLSNKWKPLKLFSYQYTSTDGRTEEQVREVYDKGDGAAVFMYNKQAKKVLLTKQFRMPAYINGVASGIVTEVPAGMLDKDDPETCIIREIEEETGYRVPKVKKVRDCFMTPGAVTEITHMFVAEYDESMKVAEGGGLNDEQEDIIVFEMGFAEVKKAIENNEFNDAKTLILLQYAWIHNLLED
ncbi:NUDIX domain-containing protein [Wenyingzhuangia marina]|uniref:GDP-mannose pyrophosphatase n=1 Tax=Wenyingzhuangia marina TaxID=1195760 RepID=A0A1M5V1P0_9FLAO|nr:NUDIX domain-containing protein [Wenyingzhuangia marina]GGF74995.1 GDP-mannose pyrophosphatase NudK [Wenyingzhuangia marina]SHH69217.1 nudix-type nucleoside diphosphatase, YffH/AdpP family [Wenyingzhuangia marina]